MAYEIKENKFIANGTNEYHLSRAFCYIIVKPIDRLDPRLQPYQAVLSVAETHA